MTLVYRQHLNDGAGKDTTRVPLNTVYVVYLAVILIWQFGELQVNRQI